MSPLEDLVCPIFRRYWTLHGETHFTMRLVKWPPRTPRRPRPPPNMFSVKCWNLCIILRWEVWLELLVHLWYTPLISLRHECRIRDPPESERGFIRTHGIVRRKLYGMKASEDCIRECCLNLWV